MTQHYKDNQNNLYGYKPKGIEVTPITMEEVNQINEAKKPSLTNDDIIQMRQARYKQESDPLYMEWQFDGTDVKKQAWLDKVAEIKADLPFVE